MDNVIINQRTKQKLKKSNFLKLNKIKKFCISRLVDKNQASTSACKTDEKHQINVNEFNNPSKKVQAGIGLISLRNLYYYQSDHAVIYGELNLNHNQNNISNLYRNGLTINLGILDKWCQTDFKPFNGKTLALAYATDSLADALLELDLNCGNRSSFDEDEDEIDEHMVSYKNNMCVIVSTGHGKIKGKTVSIQHCLNTVEIGTQTQLSIAYVEAGRIIEKLAKIEQIQHIALVDLSKEKNFSNFLINTSSNQSSELSFNDYSPLNDLNQSLNSILKKQSLNVVNTLNICNRKTEIKNNSKMETNYIQQKALLERTNSDESEANKLNKNSSFKRSSLDSKQIEYSHMTPITADKSLQIISNQKSNTIETKVISAASSTIKSSFDSTNSNLEIEEQTFSKTNSNIDLMDAQKLQEYLRNILIKVQVAQANKRKVKRRNACVQTVNDLITDESPEYAARCPSLRKKELIYSPDLFDQVDDIAIKAPEFEELSNLVNYLTNNCENELFKVRALFKWIANNISFNWNCIQSNDAKISDDDQIKKLNNSQIIDTISNEENLLKIKNVFKSKEGTSKDYAILFAEMCHLCNVRCKIIEGFAKNYDYRPGHKYLIEDLSNPNCIHYWTAVFVLGNWHLIDITWGTGYTDPMGKFQRKLNEFYFFTDPECLVWTHFPYCKTERDYNRWQLLDKPITLEEFNDLPKVTANFFEFNLKIRSKISSPIAFRVQTEIKIAAHEAIRYKFKMYPADELENSCLNHYVFCQLKEERLVASFVICPPVEGRFFLKLYAKTEKEMQDQNPANTSLHYVATLLLECNKARKYQSPYPLNELPWGPAQSFYTYQMQLINQNSAIISTWGGKRKLIMQCNEPMLLTYQIMDSDGQEMDTRTIINRDDENSTNLITLNILPPRVGMFKLMIFGMPKPKQKGKWRLPLLATFLVDCKLAKLPPTDEDPPAMPAEIVENLSAIDNKQLNC